jgi:hypothetical protein
MTTKNNNMKAIGIIIAATSLDLALAVNTFVGPGIIECNVGQCEFSGRAGPVAGCSDPCHTIKTRHSFDFAFREVSDISGPQSYGGKQCYFKYAKNIDSYYPDQYVEIERGCTAKCSGCVFAPTILFRKFRICEKNTDELLP